MGSNNDEFVEKIRGVVERNLKDLTNAGYQTAEERSIESVGQQLKEVYEFVMNHVCWELT